MARITGKIHDQNMAPVIGAPVSVIEADAPHADLAAMSDENGCYTLGGLTPGRYTIGARGVTARAEIVEDADETRCALCDRDRPLTFHHLIPKALHRKKRYRALGRAALAQGVDLCRDCHDAVHRFIDEKTLGAHFSTLDALRAHPDVAKFVAWVRRRGGRHRLR